MNNCCHYTINTAQNTYIKFPYLLELQIQIEHNCYLVLLEAKTAVISFIRNLYSLIINPIFHLFHRIYRWRISVNEMMICLAYFVIPPHLIVVRHKFLLSILYISIHVLNYRRIPSIPIVWDWCWVNILISFFSRPNFPTR